MLIATATGICTGLGSVPFWLVPSLPRRAYDALLGLGAGLMLSAATLGLLSQALQMVRENGVLHQVQLGLVLLGFGAAKIIRDYL